MVLTPLKQTLPALQMVRSGFWMEGGHSAERPLQRALARQPLSSRHSWPYPNSHVSLQHGPCERTEGKRSHSHSGSRILRQNE